MGKLVTSLRQIFRGSNEKLEKRQIDRNLLWPRKLRHLGSPGLFRIKCRSVAAVLPKDLKKNVLGTPSRHTLRNLKKVSKKFGRDQPVARLRSSYSYSGAAPCSLSESTLKLEVSSVNPPTNNPAEPGYLVFTCPVGLASSSLVDWEKVHL